MPGEPSEARRPPISWPPAESPSPSAEAPATPEDETSRAARETMVSLQIASRGVRDPSVLAAMREVPRHLFVPPALRQSACADHPLPIGRGQTISQPFIVALMTELVRPALADRALEVGTGSGYQAAILSRVVRRVFTLEIDEDLCREARERLARLGYANVSVFGADGYAGLPGEAPFDIVVVTAAPAEIPRALVDQLSPGGRLVAPVGPRDAQELVVVEKDAGGTPRTRAVLPVVFVPMVHAVAIDGRGSPT